jgi:hypothetical protein
MSRRNEPLGMVSARGQLRSLRQELKKLRLNSLVDMVDNTLEFLEHAQYSYSRQIEEAKMIGLRNPSFDGDMIGWLDDDFDWDDMPDNRKKKK